MKNVSTVIVVFIFLGFYIFTPAVLALIQIDINAASLAQLDTLTGIGPVYAQRIIDGRPYFSIDDLDRVKGIGPATLQKIKDQGLACVGCQTTQEIVQPTTPTPSPAKVLPEQNLGGQAPTPVAAIYTSGVFINEILPNPKGADETDEWIELYNSNNFVVDLTGWKIQDTAGTAKTYTIGNLKISAYGFLVLKRPDTKIMLNNDEDGLNLLMPDNRVAFSVNYSKAPLGQSYSRASGTWMWSSILTPGAKNIIPAPADNGLQNAKKSDNSNVEAKDLTASLIDSVNQKKIGNSSPWFLFFTVLIATIILATTVLFIKLKFKNYERT